MESKGKSILIFEDENWIMDLVILIDLNTCLNEFTDSKVVCFIIITTFEININ